MSCGCGYKNGAWKYDMQHMEFKEEQMKIGPVEVQPPSSDSSAQYFEDGDRYEG
jgi:hypothetical protein